MALLFLGVAFAQGGAVAQKSSDLEKVKATSQAFYAALNAREPECHGKGVCSYSIRCIHTPVGSEIAVGWEAVNKSWEEVLHNVTSKIDMSYNRAGVPQIDGNLAWEVGTREGQSHWEGKPVIRGPFDQHLSEDRWSLAHDFSPSGSDTEIVIEPILRDARHNKPNPGNSAPQ